MNGKEVFRFATATIVQCIEDVIEKNRVQKEEIDYVVCHQANKRIIDYAQKNQKFLLKNFMSTLRNTGTLPRRAFPLH